MIALACRGVGGFNWQRWHADTSWGKEWEINSLSWSLGIWLAEWVIRLVMLGVVLRRRRPAAAMAWLLIIFFLPWAGIVLYALIGRHRLTRRRSRQHARMLERLRDVTGKLEKLSHVERPLPGPVATAAVALAQKLSHIPILGGNDLKIVTNTSDVIDRLAADIDSAEQHVHLLFYIFEPDASGRRIAEALIRAARRGVKCRVLADAVGSRALFKKLAPELADKGVEIHEALHVGIFRRRLARLDMRNHRKLAVIDGRTAWTGSQNIIDETYGYKNLVFSDLMVRVQGPVVMALQTVFMADWQFNVGQMPNIDDVMPEPKPCGSMLIQALPSGPNYPTANYQRLVVAAIHAAQERVTITTPYFIPDEATLQALQTAVLRGVIVEVILPRKSDHWLVCAASRAYHEDLFRVGARIYLYEKGILHAKTVSIDDKIALIGSSNFDIRSFALNFEINLVCYGADVTERLRTQQRRYRSHSHRLTRRQFQARPKLRTFGQRVARLLSPLL